ncbi:MAG: helix-turn-helix transcriptional regulator [Chloroflexi bacterium]|nr:helix-turn-helix transcriptional regulator [Chloroflexota bacterium]
MITGVGNWRVGPQIRALRKRRRWRQQDLAARMRVSREMISRIENDRLDNIPGQGSACAEDCGRSWMACIRGVASPCARGWHAPAPSGVAARWPLPTFRPSRSIRTGMAAAPGSTASRRHPAVPANAPRFTPGRRAVASGPPRRAP